MTDFAASAFAPTSSSRRARMLAMLTTHLAPTRLDLRDESHLHASHNPEAASGGTHFRLTIASPQLAGLSRVDRQRRINQILQPEFATGLHALAITVVDQT